MSHATVLVIGDDIEEQMAPYNENIVVPPYWQKVALSPEEFPGRYIAKEAPELDLTDYPAVAAWLNDKWSDEGTYQARADGVYEERTYNPQSKWDWYVVGGRWRGMLRLLPGCEGVLGERGVFNNEAMRPGGVDRARKGDVDWVAMRMEAVADVEKCWDAYEADLAAGKISPGRGSLMYGINEGDTREKFLAEALTAFPLSTHAVLAEGVWREVGRMGWWGVSSDDESDRLSWADWYQRFMDGLPDEAILTIVDYHI